MRIAYIGPGWGTSLQRAKALERLGHTVGVVDPWQRLGRSKWVARWLHHAGGIGVGVRIDRAISAAVREMRPETIWVDQGPFLGPTLIRGLRRLGAPIINYTLDDPFNGRDGRRFRRYLKALPYYDLMAFVREENLEEARRLGAKGVMRVWRSADEVAHRPRALTDEQRARYASDVCFVGTWMPERGPFMLELVRRGVPLSIWGDKWHKAPEWPVLKGYWRGPGLYRDEDYAAAIQSAKVCLGLLSKGNRDLHTQRSLEIPAMGGVLCAEGTTEHRELYRDGEEAIFWDDARTCANVCHSLLNDVNYCEKLGQRGYERAQRNKNFNEPVVQSIIDTAFASAQRANERLEKRVRDNGNICRASAP